MKLKLRYLHLLCINDKLISYLHLQIHDNNLLKYGFVKFESKKGKELARYLEHIIEDPENCENSSKDKYLDYFFTPSVLFFSLSVLLLHFLHLVALISNRAPQDIQIFI